MTDVAGVDPDDHATLTSFKSAVYDAGGTGTWLDDAKLELVFREAHDLSIPDRLQPLVEDETDG